MRETERTNSAIADDGEDRDLDRVHEPVADRPVDLGIAGGPLGPGPDGPLEGGDGEDAERRGRPSATPMTTPSATSAGAEGADDRASSSRPAGRWPPAPSRGPSRLAWAAASASRKATTTQPRKSDGRRERDQHRVADVVADGALVAEGQDARGARPCRSRRRSTPGRRRRRATSAAADKPKKNLDPVVNTQASLLGHVDRVPDDRVHRDRDVPEQGCGDDALRGRGRSTRRRACGTSSRRRTPARPPSWRVGAADDVEEHAHRAVPHPDVRLGEEERDGVDRARRRTGW